jgi:hypothetical protein
MLTIITIITKITIFTITTIINNYNNLTILIIVSKTAYGNLAFLLLLDGKKESDQKIEIVCFFYLDLVFY